LGFYPKQYDREFLSQLRMNVREGQVKFSPHNHLDVNTNPLFTPALHPILVDIWIIFSDCIEKFYYLILSIFSNKI
jgi:hypothetical protein